MFWASIGRACAIRRRARTTRSARPAEGPGQERRRFGYRRLHVLLRREGHAVNRKRVQRIYRDEQLTVRRRAPQASDGHAATVTCRWRPTSAGR
uniref:Insertion element ISR1 uncharacterized 11 kDa protein A1 n=1 Tax=Rhizobium sp. TaxID=391 RepID=YIA1_RHISP|nr:RecName: Full=Insertion element ISR1 uncharacterized 11 kDa protein A1 [Rhizobium sp.]CAA29831.1 unnamed protein product [Rhizobium sp.]